MAIKELIFKLIEINFKSKKWSTNQAMVKVPIPKPMVKLSVPHVAMWHCITQVEENYKTKAEMEKKNSFIF